MIREPAPTIVARLLDKVEHVSDRGREGLTAWANEFIAAHKRVPGGLTIEVGTRIGGSAALWGGLIEQMYEPGRWPPLWTVDPYGSKPYVGGDKHGAQPPIYDSEVYSVMKQNLAGCPFHAHWLLTSSAFFHALVGATYWVPGEKTMRCTNERGELVDLPIGEERYAGNESASFILLDGEHSADSIMFDITDAYRWLMPGGTIVVDNIDTDPETLPRLHSSVLLTSKLARVACKYDVQNRWLFVYRVAL